MVATPTSAESDADGFKTTPVFREIQAQMKAVGQVLIVFKFFEREINQNMKRSSNWINQQNCIRTGCFYGFYSF